MSPAEIRELILRIDNEPGILDYELSNGLSIWLIFRHDLYYYFLGKSVEGSANQLNTNISRTKRIQKKILLTARYALRSYLKNPFKIKQQYEVLNFCTTAGSYLSGDCYRSRMSGFLSDIPGIKTLNVFHSHNRSFHKKYCGDYCFADFFLLKEEFRNKLSFGKRDNADCPAIDLFFNHIRKFTIDVLSGKDIAAFRDSLTIWNNYSRGYEKSVRRFLKNVKPRLLVIEDGNYGNWLVGIIIKVAREMQLPTAEIQHGVFDVAFQYGEKLLNNKDFSKYKTDYVFTFGPYFTDYIRSTSTNLSLGNYFLETRKKQQDVTNPQNGRLKLLFISQQHLTNPIIPVLYEMLKKSDKSLELIVRLHPAELNNIDRYKCLEELENVFFSFKDDIYKLIAEANFVIGLYSTVLFEVVYFDKSPLIYKNDFSDEFIPEELGFRFSNSTELLNLISNQNNIETKAKAMKAYFWTSGCVENFSEFLAQKGFNKTI